MPRDNGFTETRAGPAPPDMRQISMFVSMATGDYQAIWACFPGAHTLAGTAKLADRTGGGGMPSSILVSTLSLVVALLALTVTIWQARRTARLTRNAHQIQVIADVFREIRSAEFLEHYKCILDFPKSEKLEKGFESLDENRKKSAYAVCYFFEHLGVLVTRDLMPGDVLITTMRTLIVRSWDALECAIKAERTLRDTTYPPDAGRKFLPHFEDLCKLARIPEKESGFGNSPPAGTCSPPESS